MIFFPVLRTARFTVQLKELSMGDAIALAGIPAEASEAATTAMLKAVIQDVQGDVEDPEQWTVQERTMAICHYMASIQDGDPDFELEGGGSRYTDYLQGEKSYPGDSVEAASPEGDKCEVRQLTGAMAACIERLVGELAVPVETHWLVGRMAAQLVVNGSAVDSEGDIDNAMLDRMQNIIAYPESEFAQLLAIFQGALPELEHLFAIDSGPHGIVALPRKVEGSTAVKPAAKFPASACISELAKNLGGKPQEHGA